MDNDKIDFNNKFGTFVKLKRKELALSQSQLAAKLNNSAQNISRLERGEINPTLYWCTLLSKAFDVRLDELIIEFMKGKK